MRANKTGVLVKGALLAFGLGLVAIVLQIAMDQARRTSCNTGSDNEQCLAPSVADYGLSSDGPERKVDGPGAKPAP